MKPEILSVIQVFTGFVYPRPKCTRIVSLSLAPLSLNTRAPTQSSLSMASQMTLLDTRVSPGAVQTEIALSKTLTVVTQLT